MNWLITGGCGFLGTSLIHRLVKEGDHAVRVVDNLSVGTRDDIKAVGDYIELDPASLGSSSVLRYHDSASTPIQLIVGDILDKDLAIKAAEGMDVIVHLAANTGVAPSVEDPRGDCMNNVIGTLNYLEAARYKNVKRFIFASSGAPVGECEPPIHEEIVPHPVSPYGASKLAGEGYCSSYCRTFGIETVALRFGNVYGPRSKHKNSVVAKFIREAMNGEALEIYGDGTQTRDFIFIDDLIEAICLASVTQGVGGEIFQIATSIETTLAELTEKLISVLNKFDLKNIKIKNVPSRLGDVKRNFSDTSKADKMLGWRPIVTLSGGLRQTIEWFLRELA